MPDQLLPCRFLVEVETPSRNQFGLSLLRVGDYWNAKHQRNGCYTGLKVSHSVKVKDVP